MSCSLRLTDCIRGIAVGSRSEFEDMNRYLEENKVHFDSLLVDQPFTFEGAKDAYNRLESGKFHGKIVIRIT
jgi:D-arabinose 1-dehydrogenase-like Zn-dependent alcohol dehydrogenase